MHLFLATGGLILAHLRNHRFCASFMVAHENLQAKVPKWKVRQQDKKQGLRQGGEGMTPAQRDLMVCEFGRRLKLPYPMGLAEMLEESLEIYRQNFALLFGLALIPALLSTAFATIANLWLTLPSTRGLEPLLIAAMVISYTLLLVTAFIGYGAQIWAAGQIIMGKSVSFGEAWMAVLKRSGALLLTMLIAFFPMLAGLALCCVGVLFTAVIFFAVLEQIILLEGVAYFRAISRHVQLVYPNWEWARVLGFYIVSYVIIMLAQLLVGWAGIVLSLAVEIGREALPLSAQLGISVAGQLWQQLANALVMPYWSVFLTLLYFDLRARHEGHDLQVLLGNWENLGIELRKSG